MSTLRPCPLVQAASKAGIACGVTPDPTPIDPGPSHAGKNSTFAGETNLETMPDGSSYQSRYSFRVF